MDGLVTPLQDRIEEWKKTANQLDKDHAKGSRTFRKSSVLDTNPFTLGVFIFFFFFLVPQNTNDLVRKSKGSLWTPSSSRRKQGKVRALRKSDPAGAFMKLQGDPRADPGRRFSLNWRHLECRMRSAGWNPQSKCMAPFQKLLCSLG